MQLLLKPCHGFIEFPSEFTLVLFGRRAKRIKIEFTTYELALLNHIRCELELSFASVAVIIYCDYLRHFPLLQTFTKCDLSRKTSPPPSFLRRGRAERKRNDWWFYWKVLQFNVSFNGEKKFCVSLSPSFSGFSSFTEVEKQIEDYQLIQFRHCLSLL